MQAARDSRHGKSVRMHPCPRNNHVRQEILHWKQTVSNQPFFLMNVTKLEVQARVYLMASKFGNITVLPSMDLCFKLYTLSSNKYCEIVRLEHVWHTRM